MRTRAWGLLIVVAILVIISLVVLLVWRGGEPGPVTPTQSSPLVPTVSPRVSIAPTDEPQPSATATPAPLVYTIQDGDTVSGVARRYGVTVADIVAANNLPNPDVLSVGQQIIIPGHFITPTIVPTVETPAEATVITSTLVPQATSESSLPAPPTPTLSGPPVVEIELVEHAGSLPTEVVVLRNRGGRANLKQWTLSDGEGNTFTFPDLTLFNGAQVRIHTTVGTSTPSDVYWNRTSPAWSSGELLSLRDAAGNTVSSYIVP